jgi:hypothetical protein
MEKIERKEPGGEENLLNVFRKRNREYQLLKWTGESESAPSFHYLEQLERFNSLYASKLEWVNVSIPNKINHINAVALTGCKLSVRNGTISGIELTRCKNTTVVIKGSCPIVQIDLCENITLKFLKREDAAQCKIVHASNQNVFVFVEEEDVNLQSSLLGDQVISFFKDGQLASVQTGTLKHETRGYLDLQSI